MQITIKLTALLLAADLLAGCARESDIDNLQTQINKLDSKINAISANTAETLSAAKTASDAAVRAEAAAQQAAQSLADINNKLDKILASKPRTSGK